jgi:uncharacterized surface protein with fasciclin (FAS1) repeats
MARCCAVVYKLLTVVDVLRKDVPRFGRFLTALEQADLIGLLSGVGPFTVFAPQGGSKLLEAALQGDKFSLSRFLRTQMIAGELFSTNMTQNRSIMTLGSSFVELTVRELPGISGERPSFQYVVGTATLLSTDVRARNGVVHFVSDMLLSTLEIRSASPTANPTQVHSAHCARVHTRTHAHLLRRPIPLLPDRLSDFCTLLLVLKAPKRPIISLPPIPATTAPTTPPTPPTYPPTPAPNSR